MLDVVIRDAQWRIGRVIWDDPRNDIQDSGARVDYLGESVAWTRGRWPGAYDIPWFVALKPLDDDASAPPRQLGRQFESVAFCDWTPHNDLLVTIRDKGQVTLAVMNTEGQIQRTLPTPKGLYSADGGAQWRRYEPFLSAHDWRGRGLRFTIRAST